MLGRRSVRTALVWIGLAASLGFAYLAVRGVDLDTFWSSLRRSNYWWLIPSFLVLAACIFLRAVRWRLLFTPATRPPLGPVSSALLIGYLFNAVLPARAGEAARIVALNQRAGTSRVEALGTAVTERVFDILALLVLLFVAVPFLPEVSWLRRAAYLGVALALGVVGVVAALLLWGERPVRWALRPVGRLPGVSAARIERAAANLVQGLAGFHRPGQALVAFTLTIASWLVLAVSYWLVLVGFELGPGFGAGLLVVVATNLAMIIPSSPGALGVLEAAVLVSLDPYGIGKSEALSYAIVLHALNLLPIVVIGYAVLHRHVATLRRRPVSEPSAG